MPLLEITNLTIEFGSGARATRAVDDVSLTIASGETLCLVGESGCGKSVTALSIGRLLPTPPARYVTGTIRLDGKDVLAMDKRSLRQMRGGVVSYIFQEPSASLNPVFTVGAQIREMLRQHRPEVAPKAEAIRLLRLVGIPAPETRLGDYPHQLSGGMQQRVVIAMALAAAPKLLVADEPTTALDVTIQAQILDLLRAVKQELGTSILLITHNLAIVADIGDRAAVMYAGHIVELGPASALLQHPLHPYTQALRHAVPVLGAEVGRLRTIAGNVPTPGRLPSGCRFHPRCTIAQADCSRTEPELLEVEPTHFVRCPYGRSLPNQDDGKSDSRLPA